MNFEVLEIVEWCKQQRWSDYARKVLIYYEKNRTLTDTQIDTVKRMRENRERGLRVGAQESSETL